MVNEHRQKQADQEPIEIDFGPGLIPGDDIDEITIIAPTGVSEITARRVIIGQSVQIRFDIHAVAVGTNCSIQVRATTDGGDIKTFEFPLIVT